MLLYVLEYTFVVLSDKVYGHALAAEPPATTDSVEKENMLSGTVATTVVTEISKKKFL